MIDSLNSIKSIGSLFIAMLAIPTVTPPELTITAGYIGVPINVLVACAAGAYASFSTGDPVKPRKKMFNLWFACLIMGALITGFTEFLLNHFADMHLPNAALAGMGGFISWSTKFWLPWLAEVLRSGSWIKFIPFLNTKKSGD